MDYKKLPEDQSEKYLALLERAKEYILSTYTYLPESYFYDTFSYKVKKISECHIVRYVYNMYYIREDNLITPLSNINLDIFFETMKNKYLENKVFIFHSIYESVDSFYIKGFFIKRPEEKMEIRKSIINKFLDED